MELITYIENHFVTTLILFARIIGLFIFMPGFSSKSITLKIKILLSLSLSILIGGFIEKVEIANIYVFLLRIIAEFLGGFIIGFISSLFVQSINIIGSLIDNLLGTGIFQIADNSGNMSSTSSKLIECFAILLFFLTNSHLYIIQVISMNLDFLKLYDVLKNDGFMNLIISILNFIFINGLHLSMPFILIFLIVDISLGIINRSFTSFNVFLFSMPIKMLLFVAILFYYLVFFKENFGNFMNINLEIINNFIELLV